MKKNEELEKSLLQKLFNKDGLPKNNISYGDLTKEEYDYFMKKVATSLTVDVYRNSIIEDYHAELEDLTQEVMKKLNIDICDRMYVKVITGSGSDKYIPYMFIAAFASLWNPADWIEPSAIPYMLDIAKEDFIKHQTQKNGDYHIEIITCVNGKSFIFDIDDYDNDADIFFIRAEESVINEVFDGNTTFAGVDFYAIMRNATDFSYSIEEDDEE